VQLLLEIGILKPRPQGRRWEGHFSPRYSAKNRWPSEHRRSST